MRRSIREEEDQVRSEWRWLVRMLRCRRMVKGRVGANGSLAGLEFLIFDFGGALICCLNLLHVPL